MNILKSWCGTYRGRMDIAGHLGQKEKKNGRFMVFWGVTFGGIS